MHPDTRSRSHGLLDLVGGTVVDVVVDGVVDGVDGAVTGFGVATDDPMKINCFGVDTFQIGFSLVTGFGGIIVVELVPTDSVLGGT